MGKINCWEFKNCGKGKNSSEPCPAATRISLSGLNNGKNGGRICWSVAGTFSDGTTPGIFSREYSSCINCEFFKLVEKEEGENFDFFTSEQLSRHDPYIYGKRKSARFDIHLDMEMKPSNKKADIITGVTSNVSSDGFSFVSEQFHVDHDQPVEFRIRHPQKDEYIRVMGTFVWKRQVRDRCLAGVRMCSMDDLTESDIFNYASDSYVRRIRSLGK